MDEWIDGLMINHQWVDGIMDEWIDGLMDR